jgi:YbgC/YbaW family acyl-CoA thioester hydrolase
VSATPFVIREYVRWGDVDFAGIIRYDAYARFMELAEGELLRSVGVSHRDFTSRWHFSIPRRAMHVDFESPPTLDERLTVVAYISRVGSASLTLNFDFFGERDVLRAAGYLVLVCVVPGAGKASPWPAEFIELLSPYRMDQDRARDPAHRSVS